MRNCIEEPAQSNKEKASQAFQKMMRGIKENKKDARMVALIGVETKRIKRRYGI